RRKQRESYIAEVINILKAELEKEGLKAEVFGRPKHIYSIYQKINRYSAIGKDFNDIHDLFALRVLVDTIPDCYRALGIIHNLWHPLPDEFNDHIANPKENGYQSLHTTVLSMGRTPLEIQIRTFDMHRVADYGEAAHWRYKEGTKQDKHFEERVTWLRLLIDWQTELDSEQFMESVKTDIFIDQVFVYTPKGEIKALPRGATPLDFAYLIHTELGHRCIGAKVNGRMVQLNHTLRNGDIVEIMSTKADRGPSLDWLNAEVGYVKTSHAREKIRQWFKKQERTQNIERGKQLLERELKRTGISLPNNEDTAKLFNCDSYDDFLAAIGQGIITQRQFVLTLTKESEPEPEIVHKTPPIIKKYDTTGVQVMGVGDLLTHLAACCSPLPGDDIVGYITRSHGITVHRKDCVNIINLKERERLIDVSWGKTQEVYLVHIHIDAWDRLGLLRDITTLVADEKVNIMGINLTEMDGDNVVITADLEIRDMTQLHRLLNKIRAVRGVSGVDRSNPAQVGLNS
ncbi:MAG: TGS domain-containing protein, partial [Dehalococcoidia bacterium]